MTLFFNMGTKFVVTDNFKTLCDLTTSLVGLPKGSLSLKSRKLEYQIPRTAASVVARMVDDIHPNIIAKHLKRSRCLVYHYERMHTTNYRSFPKYRKVFNLIYNAYQTIQGAKQTFTDLDHLRDYLKENGIKDSERPQTIIRIHSGRIRVDINVSYKDFYEQLEKCQAALLECSHTITII
jgi:hypothetical protein